METKQTGLAKQEYSFREVIRIYTDKAGFYMDYVVVGVQTFVLRAVYYKITDNSCQVTKSTLNA